jgi:hypothetical protein
MADPLEELETKWLDEAEQYERVGALVKGDLILRRVVDDLRRTILARASQVLTVGQAARESGYSESHLFHLLESHRIPNAGDPNRPRVRRADLPKKRRGRSPSLITRDRAQMREELLHKDS